MVIVIQSPTIYNIPRLSQAQEQLAIKAFVPELTVEAFNVTILPRTTRLDEQGSDLLGGQPLLDGLAGEFRAVVTPDVFGSATDHKQLFQDLHNVTAGELPGYLDCQTFSCELLNHIEHPEPTTFLGAV